MNRLPIRLLLAAFGGLGLALANSTTANLAWLAIPAAALIVAQVGERSRENATIGFASGFAYFLMLLSWLDIVGVDAKLGTVAFCAAWWLLAFGLSHETHMWRLPVLITAAELLRDRIPWGGFGWGQLGALGIELPAVSGWLPLVGQVGLTLLLWTVAVALTAFWRRPDLRLRVMAVGAVAALVGVASPLFVEPAKLTDATVALVQAGVDRTGLGTVGDRRAVLDRHVRLTTANLSALNDTELVVWPENSSDVDPASDRIAAGWLSGLDQQLLPPLLLGAVVERDREHVANVVMRVDAGEREEIYAKQRLVPFGEFLPMRALVSAYTERAALMPRDFEPGERPGTVRANGTELGLLICFEVADDNLAWDREGDIGALLVQTNNATYDGTEQSQQQLRYARVRAAEMQIPVYLVSTNGVSAVIAPGGEVIDSIQQGNTGVMIARLPGATVSTPAAYLHDFLVVALLSLGAIFSIQRWLRVRS